MNIFEQETEIISEDIVEREMRKIMLEIQAEKINKDIFSNQDKVKPGANTTEKYTNLINIFFSLKELIMLGKLGYTTKGEVKQIKSIEKFAKVFLIRFHNSRPEFYSFKKASGLTNISIKKIQELPNLLRFELEDLFNLLEWKTKEAWRVDMEATTLFSSGKELATSICEYYKNKILELQNYYCIRRLFTYEEDRLNNKVEYAQLTPDRAKLPNWFLLFKADKFDKLTRKEQLVAYFNEYHNRYSEIMSQNPEEFEWVNELQPSSEDIKVHKFFRK